MSATDLRIDTYKEWKGDNSAGDTNRTFNIGKGE